MDLFRLLRDSGSERRLLHSTTFASGATAVLAPRAYTIQTAKHARAPVASMRRGAEAVVMTVSTENIQYHIKCVGLSDVPKGSWYCPWHACWDCARKSTDVGGQLFHCMTCPLTYCFDCAPDAYTEGNAVRTTAAAATAALLEQRGIYSTKSYLFFHCDDCKTERRKPPSLSSRPPTQAPQPSPPSAATSSEESVGSSSEVSSWCPSPGAAASRAGQRAARAQDAPAPKGLLS